MEPHFFIENLYDSHVHWLMTGEYSSIPRLENVHSVSDLQKLGRKPNRGEWFFAFGWDENLWKGPESLNQALLDKVFGDTPSLLVRVDGHASLVNTKASEVLAKRFPDVLAEVWRSGLLKELDHVKALTSLPAWSESQQTEFLLKGQSHFLSKGYTHIREMTGSPLQWKLAQQMEQAGQLKMQVEMNFLCESLNLLPQLIEDMKVAKKQESKRRRVAGVKIFLDGSLGSETAFLSAPYEGSQNKGLLNFADQDVKEILKMSWKEGFDLAIHTLGDAAVDKMVDIAREVSAEGILGRLHLEHVEILKFESLQKMKPLHVVCHLQPVHFLSDRVWLKKKLGARSKQCFPWGALEKAGIHLQFGSDSPICEPDLPSLMLAVELAEKEMQIPAPRQDVRNYCYFKKPVGQNCARGRTEFREGRVENVWFENELVYQAPQNLGHTTS